MVRVSEHYALGRSQPSLEFLDVDIQSDTYLFIDPSSIRSIASDWSDECLRHLQSFFGTVIDAIREERHQSAHALLASLSEPNETHLGLSVGLARGRGMGSFLAARAWKSISASRAVATGLLEDLEDAILFVEGIGRDIISDITTNVIRSQLIQFTQDASAYYGIPLTDGVYSGRLWNPEQLGWVQGFTSLPVTPFGPLVLVPKSIVRMTTAFDPAEYYDHYVIPALQDDLMAASRSMAITLRDPFKRPTKKDTKKEYGGGKGVNLSTTLKHPDILDRYRNVKGRGTEPLSHEDIASSTQSSPPDWDALVAKVRSITAGEDGATAYHHAVEELLTALFYPALDLLSREADLHEGRKRIDIVYTNLARRGFFDWVHRVHGAPAQNVVIECKNYTRNLGNPELDQITGRFAPQRGRLGLLLYRGFGDKALVIQRCRDAARDGRGYVVALDDDDLVELVEDRRANPHSIAFDLLRRRFFELV